MKLFGLFHKKEKTTLILPQHIGIIMDGNGRWAKKRGMPRSAGHSAGARTFRAITRYCNRIGIRYLTVYAFSTENWSRPKEEVDAIMKLFHDYLVEALEKFRSENIRTRFIGDLSVLSPELLSLIAEAEETSLHATGMTLNIAINYGGRQEIARAAKMIAQDVREGKLLVNNINEKELSKRIYTAEQPDPDLIIRPSGEQRLSNFLLWQAAYAEFWYSDILWPDFTTGDLDRALEDYSKRNRRFGGV
ncbi:MAG: isoprenyl transferase [Clostridia bacterium]|nr:isoprenyl transferase [Clostridia bacterium]MDR3644706.1 isoprenyl transferase [Clostridia bacterium]